MTQQTNETSVFKAAVFGSVIGSAVTAGLFLLRNKEGREKLFDSIDTALGNVQKQSKTLRKQAEIAEKSADGIVQKVSRQVKKVQKIAQDKIDSINNEDSNK